MRWAALLREIEALRGHPRTPIRVVEPSEADREISRFKRESPFICEALKLEKARPVRVFEPGQDLGCRCWLISGSEHPMDFDEFLARHVPAATSANSANSTPWSRWMRPRSGRPTSTPASTRNSRAIVAGRGLVMSVFPLDDARTPGLAVVIRTALGVGRGPVTLVAVQTADRFV